MYRGSGSDLRKMKTLQQFDLARRGLSDVLMQWQTDREQVGKVWAAGDLVGVLNSQFFPVVRQLLDDTASDGPPFREPPSQDLLDDLKRLQSSVKKFLAGVKRKPNGVPAAGLSLLAKNVEWLKQETAQLQKEVTARRRIEKSGPTNQELLELAKQCRPAEEWYQDSRDPF